MSARQSRRGLLVAASAAPALAVCGPHPAQSAPLHPREEGDHQVDAELLRLAAELRAADEAHTAAIRSADTPSGSDADADADAAVAAAFEAAEGLVRRMAAIPADGMCGLAVKALRLTGSLADAGSVTLAEAKLAESLARDLARLAPVSAQIVAAALGVVAAVAGVNVEEMGADSYLADAPSSEPRGGAA